MALKIRRGTTAQRTAVVPASGELVFDTTEVKLYIGNGSTSGGIPVVAGSIGGNLGSNINLNNYDITGTGNININGTITATGNITLGDTDADNIVFGGEVNSNIVPNTSNSLTLGASSKYWSTVYVNAVETTGTLTVNGGIKPSTTKTQDLGASNLKWRDVYAEGVYLENISIANNNIRTLDSNSNIEISASGTGYVVLGKTRIQNNVVVGIEFAPVTTRIDNDGITYAFDPATNAFGQRHQINYITYTQVAGATIETFTVVTFNAATDKGFHAIFNVTNSQGTQTFRLMGNFFGGQGRVSALLDDFPNNTGVTIIGAASLNFISGNTWELRLSTTNLINASTVTAVNLQYDLFR